MGALPKGVQNQSEADDMKMKEAYTTFAQIGAAEAWGTGTVMSTPTTPVMTMLTSADFGPDLRGDWRVQQVLKPGLDDFFGSAPNPQQTDTLDGTVGALAFAPVPAPDF